ncbi:hypothetical protein [Burkholderia stagnalis]|uniref:hypothetical protein n=1 Tax=Burkholderia stagnalis TaxID=1503054 RepID=UPI0012DA93F6|nr:hypothetical protein [Burkholderia stagnalis]
MYGEICAFADVPAISSTENRTLAVAGTNARTYHSKQPQRVTREGGSVATIAAAGAAVGGAQLDDQRRNAAVQDALVALNSAFYEDYESQPDADSKAGFECFMRYHIKAELPLLGAESSGKLVATWRKNEECLSLRFDSVNSFQFAITKKNGQDLVRRWGTSHVAKFFDEQPEAKRIISS